MKRLRLLLIVGGISLAALLVWVVHLVVGDQPLLGERARVREAPLTSSNVMNTTVLARAPDFLSPVFAPPIRRGNGVWMTVLFSNEPPGKPVR